MKEEGVIIIHTERCTDEKREEIAYAIAEFLNEKFPEEAEFIFS